MEPQELQDFLAWKPDYPEAILDRGLMYAGTKVVLFGKYKSYKSMLAIRFLLNVADGKPWLGFNTPKDGLDVLYLQLELPHPLLQVRFQDMTYGGGPTKKRLVVWTEHFLQLDTPQGMAKLETQLNRYEPKVLVIDPLYKVLSTNINEAHAMTTFFNNLDMVLDRHPGMSLMLVSHSRKSQLQPTEAVWGSDELFGSTFISAWADSIIEVKREEKGLRVIFDVVRHARDEIESVFAPIDKRLEFDVETLSFRKT